MPANVAGRKCLGLWVLLCALLTLVLPLGAQDGKQLRVLALYVTSPGAAGAAVFDTVYQQRLGEALGGRLDFHGEYIDVARFSMPGYLPALADFLRYKYTQLPLDLVIATTEGSRQFVERFRDDLFPGIPVVFIDRVSTSPPRPGMTGIRPHLDLAGTLDMALTLQPGTRQVFVISGVSDFDRFYERLAHEQLQRFAGRVTLTYLPGLAFAELERTAAHLPADSIIYFLSLAEDGAGARFLSTDARDQLSMVANVPVYGWNGVSMGRGTVGGRLYSNEIVAERSAELSLRILRGEKPDSIPVVAIDPYVTEIDWRQLKRFGISAARIPESATILFREPTLWDRYKVYIAGTLALMLFQTALIAALLFQRIRRRRTEAALRESEERFRLMADTAPVMIWLAGTDKRYSFFNQRWLDFRGRTLQHKAGDGWTEGIHPEDAARCRETYAAAFDARQPFHREFRFKRIDGEYCWMRDTGVPRVAQDGSFAGYIGSCIEITDLKRAERDMLENQAMLQASHAQISDLFGRLIAAQETERTRMARDLHDDISQRVAGLSLMISGVKRKLLGQPDDSDVLAALSAMQRNTMSLAEEIRRVSHDLHPSLLQHTGLIGALRVFCAEFEKLQAIAVTYRSNEDLADISDDVALCLYRITQEALRNVAKHARARHITVTLAGAADGVQLSIVDDGQGFDLARTRGKRAGLGLVSIDERARLLGGSVTIDTQPRHGTQLQIHIPCARVIAPAPPGLPTVSEAFSRTS